MVDESHGNGFTASSHGSHENPPIKTNHNNKNNDNPTTTNHSNNINSKEQDKFLPIANVGRIMKKVTPAPGKISKEAKETVQECVSEFISFITVEASEKCQHEKRKTINGDDIIWSINTLGFEDYVNPLKVYLKKYREIEDEKPAAPKQQQQRSSFDQSPSQQQLQMMHHHQQQLPDHHLRPHLDHQHQLIDQKPIINQKLPQIDQNSVIGGAHSGGLAPFPSLSNVYSPQSTPNINQHHHHQQQPPPPPPPPSFVGADQALITLPSFLSSNSLQKTYHQPPEQIDYVGHW